MSDEFDDSFEPGGLTQGPEERLEREIAKSKALKLERLQLRDTIARLEMRLEALTRENEGLKSGQRQKAWTGTSGPDPRPVAGSGETPGGGLCWIWGLGAALSLAAAALAGYWFSG